MTPSPTPRPWLGAGIAIGIMGLLLVGEIAGTADTDDENGIMISIALVAAIAGLLIAKRPDNRISWILAFAATAGGLAGISASFLPTGLEQIEWWQVPLAIVGGPTWFALLLSILVLIPLYFPSGSPPGPRWGWIGPMAFTAFGVMSALYVIQERFCTDWNDDICLASVDNPIGLAGISYPEETLVGDVLYGVLIVGGIAAISSLVVRYRRAGAIERHQIKWVLFSLGLFLAIAVLVEDVWMGALGQPEPPGYTFVNQFLWTMVPASIAIAVLKYRLYDIDRIISRTVTYAVVASALGLGVALVAGLVGTRFDDPLIVAITTLGVAALFSPLRRRVQTVVDRRFNRSRFDAERVMENFAGTLREDVDGDQVVDGWASVVSSTMQPRAMGVWVRQ